MGERTRGGGSPRTPEPERDRPDKGASYVANMSGPTWFNGQTGVMPPECVT